MEKKNKRHKLDENLVTPKSWDEFRDTGLLWFVNLILNVFGWGIYVGVDEEGNIIEAFPARCKFRGFETEINDEGYYLIAKYLKDNARNIYDELEPVEEEVE